MAVRKDEYQLDIQFITDESRAFAKTIQANKGFITDLKKAQKEGKGVAEVMTQIANNGKKVEGLDLKNVAPAQLIARSRQLAQILKQIPESAPGVAKLRAEYKALNNRLANIRQQSRGVVDAGSKMDSSFGALRNRFLGITAAAGAFIGIIRGITSTAADFQRFEAVLTNALGSNSAAINAIEQISEFAARTPFQVDALVDSYTKLVNRGLKPTTQELEAIGDLAASQGKDFGQLTEAILDAGTLEFERLKEFGIQARSVGDQVQISFKGQRIEVEKTQEAITNAIIGFGNLNGVQGTTAAVSRTLGGRISNLADQITQLFRNFGEGFIGQTIGNTIALVSKLTGTIVDLTKPTRDVTKATKESQAAFNVEIETLKRGNISTENRRQLISDINTKYKEYLPQLIEETDTYADLETAQKAVNAAFRQRIILMAAEDQLVQAAKRQVEAKTEELRLAKEVEAVETRIANARGKVTRQQTQTFAGVNTARDLQLDGSIEAARKALEENQKLQQSLQTEFDDSLNAAQELGLNIGNILSPPEEERSGSGALGRKKTLAQRLKEQLDKANELYQVKQQQLEQQLIKEQITEKEYGLATLQLQQENYAEQLRLYEQFNQSRTAAAEKVRTEFLRNDTLLSRETTAISGLGASELPEQVERRSINAGLDEVANEEERAQQRLQESLNAQLINIDQFELGRLELKRQALDAEQELLRTGTEEEIRLAAEKRDQIAAIDQQIFEKKQDLATRKQQLEAEVQDTLRGVQEESVNFLIGLLGKDEDARKKNANAIKSFEIGNAIVAGLSEISQIRLAAQKEAASVAAIPGAAALVSLKAVGKAIAAGVRTAAAVSQIRSAKFERGGLAKSGFFGGRSHAAGGVKGYFDDGTQIEVEKDEAFAIVNKRSSGVLRQLSGLNVAGGGVPFFAGGGLLAPSTTPVAGVGAGSGSDGQLLAQLQQLNGNFMAFPTRLKADVVYTDIEDAGNDLNTVRSAAEV